ncbi:winged helix-turn-helix domain-containing protein [Streptomyces sp. NPDC091215]|uniref:winged helix-turn-helix domain-containing protein n=1 Tax=Streptomyces sp. NPDC091215 TaxID=3155192 RepID=UPI003442463C
MLAHEALAEVLRQRINDGTYPPGSVFPSVRQLQETFGLSHANVWRAYKALVREGRVESPPGDALTLVCVGIGQSAPNYKQELINTLRLRIEHRVYPPGTRIEGPRVLRTGF